MQTSVSTLQITRMTQRITSAASIENLFKMQLKVKLTEIENFSNWKQVDNKYHEDYPDRNNAETEAFKTERCTTHPGSRI